MAAVRLCVFDLWPVTTPLRRSRRAAIDARSGRAITLEELPTYRPQASINCRRFLNALPRREACSVSSPTLWANAISAISRSKRDSSPAQSRKLDRSFGFRAGMSLSEDARRDRALVDAKTPARRSTPCRSQEIPASQESCHHGLAMWRSPRTLLTAGC